LVRCSQHTHNRSNITMIRLSFYSSTLENICLSIFHIVPTHFSISPDPRRIDLHLSAPRPYVDIHLTANYYRPRLDRRMSAPRPYGKPHIRMSLRPDPADSFLLHEFPENCPRESSGQYAINSIY
jgi:hypothetical protein